MSAERKALHAAIVDDTLVSTVGAGSSQSVIQLGGGEAADWAVDDMCYFTGTGATLANTDVVRTVEAVDTGTDKITMDENLPVAPASTNQVKGGCREWLRYVSGSEAGLYRRVPTDVLKALVEAEDELRVVGWFALGDEGDRVLALEATVWHIRVAGRVADFIEGLHRRLVTQLDAVDLTIPARDSFGVYILPAEDEYREDVLLQRKIPIRTHSAVAP